MVSKNSGLLLVSESGNFGASTNNEDLVEMTNLNASAPASNTEYLGTPGSDRYLTGMFELGEMMRNHYPLIARQTWVHVLDAINGCAAVPAKELRNAVCETHLGDLEKRGQSTAELERLTDIELFVVSNFAQRAWEEFSKYGSVEAALSSISGRPEDGLYSTFPSEHSLHWEFEILTEHNLGPVNLYVVSAKHPSGLEDVGKIGNITTGDRCMVSGFEEILVYPDPSRTASQMEAASQLNNEIEQWFLEQQN